MKKYYVKKFLKPLSHIMEYCIFIMWLNFIRCFSIDNASDIGSKIFRKIGNFIPRSRLARYNIQKAFGSDCDISDGDIDQIMDALYDNLGRLIAEMPFILRMSYDEIKTRVEVIGEEKLLSHIQNRDPFLFVTGHFANWEIVLKLITKYSKNFGVIYKKQSNEFIDKFILKSRYHESIIPIPHNDNHALLKVIKNKDPIAILADQYNKNGVEVPFLNRRTKAVKSPAEIALRFGYTIFPIQIVRTQGCYFKFIIHDPITTPIIDSKSIHYEQEVQNLTIRINKMFEQWIIENKGQWFWLHNRWK